MNETIEDIDEAIRHWKEDWKELELFGGDIAGFSDLYNSGSCSICNEINRYNGCKMCPLPTVKEKKLAYSIDDIACCVSGAPWQEALNCYRESNDEGFHYYRKLIIKRLHRIRKKLNEQYTK